MLLYILRHADAETVAPTDDERFLSEKGIAQAQRVAKFCEARDIHPTVLLASPLRRAQETAAPLSKLLNIDILTVDWLKSGAKPDDLIDQLKKYLTLQSVMFVGHEPDLSKLCAHLLNIVDSGHLKIRKGSLTAIEIFDLDPPVARLDFLIPAKLMHVIDAHGTSL